MSQFITLREGVTMTTTFMGKKETILSNVYQNQDILPVSETFDKSTVEAILAQDGCVKLRIYYGMDEGSKVHAILVGVDEDDTDMLPSGEDDPNTQIAENAQRCPTDCGTNSPFNT
jgi:hypothetical protein